MLAESTVAFRGIAIAHHGKAGFGGVDGLGIEKPQTLSLVAPTPPRAGLAMGHVRRKTAQGRVEAEAQVGGIVLLRSEQAAKAGNPVGQAIHSRPLEQVDRRLAIIMVFTGSQAIAQVPLAGHDRQVGIGLLEGPLASVRLDDLDLQVAIGAAGIDVGDLERTGRYVGGIDHEAILAHLDRRIGFSDTAHHRGIADLVVGQHAYIGLQLHAAHTHALESIPLSGGIQLAEGQGPLQGTNVTFHIGTVATELVAHAGTSAQGGVVAQTPAKQVEAVAQAQVAIIAVLAKVGVAREVGLVVGKQRGDTVIPKRGIHIATRVPLYIQLWNADQQGKAVDVELDGCTGDEFGDIQGRIVFQIIRNEFVSRQPGDIDPDLLEQPYPDDRTNASGFGIGTEHDIFAPDHDLVQMNVDAVSAGRHRVAVLEILQFNRRPALVVQELGVEFHRESYGRQSQSQGHETGRPGIDGQLEVELFPKYGHANIPWTNFRQNGNTHP